MRSVLAARPLFGWAGCALLAACTVLVGPGFGDDKKPAGKPDAKKGDKPAIDPRAVTATFIDGSVVKLTLRDDSIEVTTASGKKTIPLADIRKIEFASRVPDELAKKIAGIAARLGSEEFEQREKACDELVAIGVQAVPAVVAAAKAGDAETKARAASVIARIKLAVPEELTEVRDEDVIHIAGDKKVVGKITATGWKATSPLFGELPVKLPDVRLMRSQAFPETEDEKLVVMPDPGTMSGHQAEVGKLFAFKVTGAGNGIVWGSDIYTTDSTIASAAVHAGILKAGQTGTVKVRVLAGQASFNGSTRNGVTSQPYGPWPGAYEFVK